MILKSAHANAILQPHFDRLNVTIAQGDPRACHIEPVETLPKQIS